MRLLTARDVAERLAISESAAYRVARACEHVRVGRSLRVSEEALDAYLKDRTCPRGSSEERRPYFAGASTAQPVTLRRVRRRPKPPASSQVEPKLLRLTQPRRKKARG